MLYVAKTDCTDPYKNLALEEHLLLNAGEDVILYLWQNRHTVVIGRNQNPWAECRTSLLEEEGGHLARRLSGGGAVYHDLGNLNFTFLCKDEHYDLQKQLSVIQEACRLCGIDATFSGRNDLLADGRKFSGNAFYHSKGFSYHHGTLLIDTDMNRLGRYLSPPKAKLESKGVTSVRSRVVNLKELSPTLTCEKMKEYMTRAFEAVYGQKALLLPVPEEAILLPMAEKYASADWLYGRPIPFNCTIQSQFAWGHLQVLIEVNGGVIENVQVYTDAMDFALAEQLRGALIGIPFRSEELVRAVQALPYGEDLAQMLRAQEL